MAMQTFMLSGEAQWAKIVGPAKENNFGDVCWEFDVTVTPEMKKTILRDGFPKDKIKTDDRGDFVQFRRKLMRKDGSQAKPYTIMDQYGDAWGHDLIGNGSKVQVKYMLSDRTFKGRTTLKPEALEIVVSTHVPYKPETGFQFKDKPRSTGGSVGGHGEENWQGQE